MVQLRDFVKNGRKIYGAAFNYSDPKSAKPDAPVIFLKSPSDYITEGTPIEIPAGQSLVEELELGVIIGRRCRNVSATDALDYIAGYCIALDMTVWDELQKARTKGWPWYSAKSFDTACPVGPFIPKERIPNPDDVDLWCSINGVAKQSGNTKHLVFSIGQLISFISKTQTLEANDLILTGTPPVPTQVKSGDVIEGGIDDEFRIKFSVA